MLNVSLVEMENNILCKTAKEYLEYVQHQALKQMTLVFVFSFIYLMLFLYMTGMLTWKKGFYFTIYLLVYF